MNFDIPNVRIRMVDRFVLIFDEFLQWLTKKALIKLQGKFFWFGGSQNKTKTVPCFLRFSKRDRISNYGAPKDHMSWLPMINWKLSYPLSNRVESVHQRLHLFRWKCCRILGLLNFQSTSWNTSKLHEQGVLTTALCLLFLNLYLWPHWNSYDLKKKNSMTDLEIISQIIWHTHMWKADSTIAPLNGVSNEKW